MKLSSPCLLSAVVSVSQYNTCSTFSLVPTAILTRANNRDVSGIMMAVDLIPEPEGGDEVTLTGTLDGSRLKNMGEVDGAKSDDGTIYKFWLTAQAEGDLVKEIRTQILKDAAKNANFPGFRKGQIPPYAQPQMTGFAVQEGLIKTCEKAVSAYGLKALPGSAGEVTIQEQVKEMCKGYKVGDSLAFTATFNALVDPDQIVPIEDSTISASFEEEETENSTE